MNQPALKSLVATLQQLEGELLRSDQQPAEMLPQLALIVEKLHHILRLRLGGAVPAFDTRSREMLRMQRVVDLLRRTSSRGRGEPSPPDYGFCDLLEVTEAAVGRFPNAGVS